MAFSLRVATLQDAPAIARIYSHYVLHASATFEVEPPDAATIAERMNGILPTHPWLVAESEGEVLSYAYAKVFNVRPAYQWTAESSVYVDVARHQRGMGTALYNALFEILAKQNIVTVLAGITIPNPPSTLLHARFGFREVGVFQSAGYKFGEWQNVGWFQKMLCEPPAKPEPPVPFARIAKSEIVDSALRGAMIRNPH